MTAYTRWHHDKLGHMVTEPDGEYVSHADHMREMADIQAKLEAAQTWAGKEYDGRALAVKVLIHLMELLGVENSTEGIILAVKDLQTRLTQLQGELTQAQGRVGELEQVSQVPNKYDVSMTYRQHEKKWLVRYISWGPDQKMFTGEAENLIEAVNAARQQIV